MKMMIMIQDNHNNYDVEEEEEGDATKQHNAMMTKMVLKMNMMINHNAFLTPGEESPSEDEGDSEWGDYTSLHRSLPM